jgi:hypothetical protein
MSKGKLGLPSEPRKDTRGRWVQTEASAHEAWAKLILKHRSAAAFMHLLVSRMDRNTNAVVASQGVLAKIMGCHVRSIKNYIDVLVEDRWIQVVSLGKGSTNAYVINSMVAWSQDRENLKHSSFTAQVIADADDQKQSLEGKIRKIPVLFSDEHQVIYDDGGDPPSQRSIHGLEPELPTRKDD